VGHFNRVSFPSNYSTEVAPPGHSSILAEITYNDGDTISQMTDADIIEHTVASLIAADLIPSRDKIVYTGIERTRFAYVVYDIDYQKNIAIVHEFLRERNIDLVGRFSQFEYLNMNDCIKSAIDFVRSFP